MALPARASAQEMPLIGPGPPRQTPVYRCQLASFRTIPSPTPS